MEASGEPQWVVREDASVPVLVALFVRQALGIRAPDDLPHLRGIAPSGVEERDEALERQWLAYWDMTVEPQAHPASVPLDLVEGFGTIVALPTQGFGRLHDAMVPLGAAALDFARDSNQRYGATAVAGAQSSHRSYAGAIAQHERAVGRRAHSFTLNVQVLPLSQRGVWWIGALTIAVTDGLRSDVAAFDAAIAPIIAELA